MRAALGAPVYRGPFTRFANIPVYTDGSVSVELIVWEHTHTLTDTVLTCVLMCVSLHMRTARSTGILFFFKFYLFLAVLDFFIIIIIVGLHMLSLVAVSMGYSCGARASHCCGLSCFRAQALGTQAQ